MALSQLISQPDYQLQSVNNNQTNNNNPNNHNNNNHNNNPSYIKVLSKTDKLLEQLLKTLDISSLPDTCFLIGLDLECTGLSITLDRFVELGAPVWLFHRKTKWFQRIDSFIQRCRQERRMHPESIKITGITQAEIDNELYNARDVLEHFRDFLNKHCEDQIPRVCIGFNIINYDIPIMILEAERCGLDGKLYFQSLKLTSALDLLPICRESIEKTRLERKKNGTATYTLGSVYKALMGKVLSGAHNALLDANGTLEILEIGFETSFKPYLLASMSARPDIHRLNGVFNPINLVAGRLKEFYKIQDQEKKQNELLSLSLSNEENENSNENNNGKRKFFQTTGMDVMDRLTQFAELQKLRRLNRKKEEEEQQQSHQQSQSQPEEKVEKEVVISHNESDMNHLLNRNKSTQSQSTTTYREDYGHYENGKLIPGYQSQNKTPKIITNREEVINLLNQDVKHRTDTGTGRDGNNKNTENNNDDENDNEGDEDNEFVSEQYTFHLVE